MLLLLVVFLFKTAVLGALVLQVGCTYMDTAIYIDLPSYSPLVYLLHYILEQVNYLLKYSIICISKGSYIDIKYSSERSEQCYSSSIV